MLWTTRKKTHGSINVLEALACSCNYYFYEVGWLSGIDAIDKVAAALGLGEYTGVEMKQTNKRFNLLISLTLLVLAVVCVCNVTFAYFSSTSQSSGDIEFPGLDATFVYQEASGGEYKTATTASLNLYSADGTISRGVPFKLSLSAGGSAIHSFGIQNSTSSCDAYVRFWIDAYPLDQKH